MQRTNPTYRDRAHKYGGDITSEFAQRNLRLVLGNLPDPKSDTRVLDIGCGNGTVTIEIAKDVKEIVGFDLTQNMLEIAKECLEKSKARNVRFFHGGAENISRVLERNGIDGRGYFDFACALGVLHHVKEQGVEKFFKEAFEVVKKGSKVVVMDMIGFDDPELNDYYLRLNKIEDDTTQGAYTIEQWKRWAKAAGFRKVNVELYPDHRMDLKEYGKWMGWIRARRFKKMLKKAPDKLKRELDIEFGWLKMVKSFRFRSGNIIAIK